MAPPVYRLISTDLRTGLRIAEVTLSGLGYSRRLNDVGTIEGVLTLPEAPRPGGPFPDFADMPTFVDTFGRADSAVSLGGEWTATRGTWGIAGGAAYLPVGGGVDPSMALIETGSGTHEVEVDVTASSAANMNAVGIALNAVDVGTHILVRYSNTFATWNVYRRTGGGAYTFVGNTGLSAYATTVRASVVEGVLTVQIGTGSPITYAVPAEFNGYTKAGLTYVGGTPHASVRWDNFTVRTPPSRVLSPADIARAAVLNDAVEENRRLIVVERDGVIVQDGIVIASPYDDVGSKRSVSCVSLWSYLRRRYLRARKSYAAVDQFDIVRDLVDYMQTVFGDAGSIGLVVESNDSGVVRDRTFEAWEVKEIGEAIEQLASVDNGFDFAIDCAWDPATGALVKTLRLANRRGRPFSSSGHVFELGRNVTSYKWPSDGSTMANRSIATGAGEGASMLIETAADSYQYLDLASGGPGYPVYEEVTSWKDVSVRANLVDRAAASVAARSTPVVLPEITLRADMDPVLGSYVEGDAARFIVPPGYSPRHPAGLDTYIRIMGWDVSVDDVGTEAVTIVAGREV